MVVLRGLGLVGMVVFVDVDVAVAEGKIEMSLASVRVASSLRYHRWLLVKAGWCCCWCCRCCENVRGRFVPTAVKASAKMPELEEAENGVCGDVVEVDTISTAAAIVVTVDFHCTVIVIVFCVFVYRSVEALLFVVDCGHEL